MKLFSNLTNYNDKNLSVVKVEGTEYKTIDDAIGSCIVAYAFGTRSCNHRLAKAVRDAKIKFGDIPIMLQREVYENYLRYQYFKGFSTDCYFLGKGHTDHSLLFSASDTIAITKEAKEFISSLNYNTNKIVVVGHPAHMYRIIETIQSYGLNPVPFIEKNVKWSDKNDKQPWTTSASKWIAREVLVRFYMNRTEIKDSYKA